MEFQELEKKLVIVVLLIGLTAKYGIVIPFIIAFIIGGKFLLEGIGVTYFNPAPNSKSVDPTKFYQKGE